MAFSAQTARSQILRTPNGGTYWIEYDSSNQYYRVVQGSKRDQDNNFGAVVYQEQLQQMCIEVGNMTWPEADRVMKCLKNYVIIINY